MTAVNKKPKLKWHRFLQFCGMPLAIIGLGYSLISYLSDLFGFNFSWTSHVLENILTRLGAGVFNLGPYFWPVVILLGVTILMLVLVFLAWTGSLSWKSSSWKCWLGYTAVGMICALAYIYAAWEYGLNRGGIIAAAQYVYARTGRTIQITSGVITAMRVLLIILAALSILYFVANVIYYMKRRSLYRQPEDVQEPYEEDEDEEAETETAAPLGQTVSEQPEAPVITEEPAPLFMSADPQEETEQTEGEDELESLLKDTEESIAALNTAEKTEPAEEIFRSSEETEIVPESEEEPVNEPLQQTESIDMPAEMINEEEPVDEAEPQEAETEPIALTLTPQEDTEETAAEEEEAPVQRFNPLSEEESTPENSLEDTQIITAPAVSETQAIRFCPDCGTRIPDPEMKFCIHCGRRIR